MKTDIEIEVYYGAYHKVAERAGIPEDIWNSMEKYKAKIDYNFLKKSDKDELQFFVTAIRPTPAGEGKTATTVGLADALPREWVRNLW